MTGGATDAVMVECVVGIDFSKLRDSEKSIPHGFDRFQIVRSEISKRRPRGARAKQDS